MEVNELGFYSQPMQLIVFSTQMAALHSVNTCLMSIRLGIGILRAQTLEGFKPASPMSGPPLA